MKNKQIIIISMLFFVVISCGTISNIANAASPIYVNDDTGSDSYDGTSPTHTTGLQGPKKTIQSAITAVTTGGVINVAPGTYHEHLTINKALTLNGASKTNTLIDGSTTGRIIKTGAGNIVSINRLTIGYGKATHGGAIYNEADLRVNDCIFKKNNADQNGGAIYNFNKLTVTKSTFTRNSASSYGGAIHNEPGSTLNIASSTFTDNHAWSSGAINNKASTLTVASTTFTNNHANDCGGAISNYGGTVTLKVSSFTQNTATYGGAIYSSYSSGSLSISGTTFAKNAATNVGGAIQNDGGTLTASSSKFTSNTASNGGAIANAGGNTVIHYSHIIGNSQKEISNIFGSVDAKYNWWGSDADPSGKVTSGILVNPWLKSPKVTVTSPKNKAKKISRTKIITIKFSSKIKASTAWKQITVKKGSKKITITKKWIIGSTLYIKTKKRIKNKYYTVNIPTNAIQDTYNINLLQKYTFKFKSK